ncbi:MAG: NAD(P)H-quinone oxidoreductase [Gemmatimonadetes bacterium]|nr:NAD(P)H-quinone oxidoreductase [Gemmatimonadota bacterium]
MKAVTIREPGDPSVLVLREVERPEPGRREILVRVRSSGVNRADVLQRRGLYPPPPGVARDIPGLEFAGVVESVGPDVTLWKTGDRVMGLVGGGGYAEFVVVHEREAVRVPDGMSLEEAGGVPEVFATAYDALIRQLNLQTSETVLIHAVGSGVGTAGVQITRAAGARTLGTSRTAAKVERARELGLDVGIVVSDATWPDAVLKATEGRGVDVVLDLVGGRYLTGNLTVLAPRGRQIVVGLTAGRTAELDHSQLLSKRLTLVGTSLRTRPIEEKIALARELEARLVPRFEAGRLRPVLDRAIPAAEAAAAHARMEADENFGKIVLVWG